MTIIDKIARYIMLSMVWFFAFFIAGASISNGNLADLVSMMMFAAVGVLSNLITWQPNQTLDKLARYGFITGLWVVVSMFSLYAMSRSSGFISLTMLAALGAVFATSLNIFPRYQNAPAHSADQPQQAASGKRKNDQLNQLSPLDLLSPEDLHELRQDIKAELRARILSGSDGELSSLDALLADTDSPRKTAKK